MTYYARTYTLAVSGSQADFPVSFPYIDQSHVQVLVKTPLQNWEEVSPLVAGVDYEWSSSAVIHCFTNPAAGKDVLIKRVTPGDNLLIQLNAPSVVLAGELNSMDVQLLYLTQEAADEAAYWSALLRDRALLVPEGETVQDITGWGPGEFLAKDAGGNPIGASGGGADAGLRAELAMSTGAALIGVQATARAASDFFGALDVPAKLTSGITDQSANLQAALNIASAYTRRVTHIGEGGFPVKDITIPDKTWVRGEGKDKTTLIRAGAMTNAGMLTFAAGAGDIVISDLTIDGDTATDLAALIAMGAHRSNIWIINVHFKGGMGKWALRGDPLAKFSGLHVINCTFENCLNGCAAILAANAPNVRGSNDIEFIGNTFIGCGLNHMTLHDLDNGLADVDRYGFWFNVKANHNRFLNVQATGIPIEIWAAYGFECIGNYLDSGTRGLTAGAGNENVIIAFNTIKNQSIYAMEGGHGRNIRIFRNVAINCASFYQDTSSAGTILEDIEIDHNWIIGTGLTAYNAAMNNISFGNSGQTIARGVRVHTNYFYDIEYAPAVILLRSKEAYPTVTFAGGGTGATGTVTLKGVGGLVRNRGDLPYTSAPTVTIVSADGNGAGATGTVSLDANGYISAFNLTAAGAGYTLPPKVTLSGGGGLGGEIELLMGIATVTPSGGTGYAASTFTVTGNGSTVDGGGTFTVSGGVPAVCTVTTAGSGFGRASDFTVERNKYYARTYPSTTKFVVHVSGNMRSRNNEMIRTGSYDNAHPNEAAGSIAYVYAGTTVPGGNPWITSEGDRAEMRGNIASGTFGIMGISEGATVRYGFKVSGFTAAGTFSQDPFFFMDSSGASILEGFDLRALTNTSLFGHVHAALALGMYSGEFLIQAGAYVKAGQTGERRKRFRYEGTVNADPAVRTIKIRCELAAGGQPPATFNVDWVGVLNNGAPQANRATVAFASASSPADAPLMFQSAAGTAATLASALNGSLMEATITLPASNNQFLVSIDAEANGNNGQAALSAYTVRIA